MKLKDYIKHRMDLAEKRNTKIIRFNVGIWPDMTVDNSSPNRIKFKVMRK
jgi:hypothetical protein